MTALLNASNDIDVLDILELGYLSNPDVCIVDARDIVITPYLT